MTTFGIMYRNKTAEMQLINNTMEDECQKEKISADEVIFFTSLEAKS